MRTKGSGKPLHEFYRINSDGCWIWLGASRGGYGVYTIEGVLKQAHRHIYEIEKGLLLDSKQHLDHFRMNKGEPCSKLCVNPDHLEPVTLKENTRRGKTTKLTLDDIQKIRTSYWSDHIKQKVLATAYNITQSAVSRIISGDTWS